MIRQALRPLDQPAIQRVIVEIRCEPFIELREIQWRREARSVGYQCICDTLAIGSSANRKITIVEDLNEVSEPRAYNDPPEAL